MGWVEGRYNGSTLDVGLIKIEVFWHSLAKGDPTGYKYRIGRFESKKLFNSMDEAQAAAVNSARKHLKKALEILGE